MAFLEAAIPPPGPDRLRALLEAAGAEWVELPVLHPADAFLETAGEDIRRRMFVTEGPAGERLALRPDFTIPVCLEHMRRGGGAARYAYQGLVFRRHDSGAPERPETGYEDIGRADRAAADAEALALALRSVAALTDRPLTVRLGDIDLFVALLSALGLPEPWRRRLRRSYGLPAMMAANLDRLSSPRGAGSGDLGDDLRRAAEAHDRVLLTRLLAKRARAHGHGEGSGRTPAEIADRFLDQLALGETHISADALAALRDFLAFESALDGAADGLRSFAAAHRIAFADALERFAERAVALRALSPGAEVRFEAGFGRPIDYYTGLVFEVRAAGEPASIAGGGRYDRLLQMLGAPGQVPAVGFTMRLDLDLGGAAR